MTLISHPSAAAPLGSKNMLRLGAARLGRAIAARTPPPPAPREAHGYRAARSSGDQGDRSGEGDAASDPAAPSQLQPAAPDFRGFGRQQQEQLRQKMSTAEALRESLGGVSSAAGRVSRSTNVVLGTDESEEKWRELDAAVNSYPGQRTFKAIGRGGDDFSQAMAACVEGVVGGLHAECISARPSSGGKYTSVTLTAWVETPDQVLEIFKRMSEDERLKFYI